MITENLTPNTITKEDIHKLFLLHENADRLEEIISRCSATIDILDEALEGMSIKGIKPSDETTIPNIIKVINDYGFDAKAAIRQLEANLSEFHSDTRNRCSVGGVV